MQRSYFKESLLQKNYKLDKTDYVGREIYRRGNIAVIFGATITSLVTVILCSEKKTRQYDNWKTAHLFLKTLKE